MWLSAGKSIFIFFSFTRVKQVKLNRFYSAAPAISVRNPNLSNSNSDEPTPEGSGNWLELNCSRVVNHLHGLRKEPFLALSDFNRLKSGGFVHDVSTYAAMIRILCFWSMDRKLDSMLKEVTENGVELGFGLSDLLNVLADDGCEVVSKVSYVLVKLLAVLEMFDEALDVLVCVKNLGVTPSIFTLNFLMNRLIHSNKVDTAVAIYRQLETCFGLVPNDYTYCIAVKAFCKKGWFGDAETVLQVMEERGVTPTPYLCSTYIEGLVEHESPFAAFEVLKFITAKLPVDKFAFTVVIRGFCKVMKVEEAIEVLAEMERQGFEPDIYAFGAVISALCRDGKLHEALGIHDEMLSRGVKTNCVVVNSILQVMSHVGMVSKALNLFQTCKSKGVYLDKFCYNTVMKAFCKLGDVDAATALLTEMKKKGIIPDFVNYTTLIHGYCCGGKLNEALKLFKEMKDNGIKPDIITYNVLASGFSRSGHTEEIKRLLDYMMDQGIEPRNDTYSVIIEGLCTAGKLKDAEAFFFDVKDQSPDICNAMVNGYCSVKSVEKAFKLVKQGCTLKKSSCWKLLSSLENDSEKSVQLAEMMLARNTDYSCTLCSKVIGTLSCAGEMEKARNLFHLLGKVGISVDLLTYTMMIHGYCKVNRLKEAIDLLDDMKKRRVKPDVITYTVLLDGALKKLPGRREQESVKNAIAYEMKEMEIEPDVGHYTVLIDRDCRTDNLQGAKELFKEMIDRGLQPDNVVYTALLCGHLNVGDRVGARVLLGEMYDKKLTRDAILDSALIQHGLLKVTKLQFR